MGAAPGDALVIPRSLIRPPGPGADAVISGPEATDWMRSRPNVLSVNPASPSVAVPPEATRAPALGRGYGHDFSVGNPDTGLPGVIPLPKPSSPSAFSR